MTEFNPARVSPRLFLRNVDSRRAIIREIKAPILADDPGKAALEIVNRFDPDYKNIPFVRSTMIVRLKTLHKYKAPRAM